MSKEILSWRARVKVCIDVLQQYHCVANILYGNTKQVAHVWIKTSIFLKKKSYLRLLSIYTDALNRWNYRHSLYTRALISELPSTRVSKKNRTCMHILYAGRSVLLFRKRTYLDEQGAWVAWLARLWYLSTYRKCVEDW